MSGDKDMVDKLGNYFLDNILYKDEKITGDQREIMLFGITRIIEDTPKYILIILISIFFNILKDVAVVALVTACYKIFIGGAHARTNLICFFSSLAFFTLPVILAKSINLSNTLIYIIYGIALAISAYVIIKIAPADTEEVPILKKEKRKKFKYFAVISLVIIYIVSLIFVKNNYINQIVIFTIILIDIMATKPAYILLKCKYSYESDEFKEYYQNTGIN